MNNRNTAEKEVSQITNKQQTALFFLFTSNRKREKEKKKRRRRKKKKRGKWMKSKRNKAGERKKEFDANQKTKRQSQATFCFLFTFSSCSFSVPWFLMFLSCSGHTGNRWHRWSEQEQITPAELPWCQSWTAFSASLSALCRRSALHSLCRKKSTILWHDVMQKEYEVDAPDVSLKCTIQKQ